MTAGFIQVDVLMAYLDDHTEAYSFKNKLLEENLDTWSIFSLQFTCKMLKHSATINWSCTSVHFRSMSQQFPSMQNWAGQDLLVGNCAEQQKEERSGVGKRK